ncbi:cation:proton antiporter [Candidatus Woesearchaeota archaeon]|nr:cation:proton antiporter [Candidatus Woesearchaeota archaeon]
MANALLATLIALLLAYLISEIFRYFSLPRVIGQILAGIILSIPIIKSWLFTNEILSIFSFITNIGIILLFFFVGLEINLKKFRKNFKESSLIAVFNTLIPLVAAFLAGKFLFHFNNTTSLILGVSVSVSSQAISLDILEEVKLLKSRIGNLIIASGTVDDVFELLLISFLLVAFHSTTLGQVSFQKLIIDIMGFVLIVVMIRILLIPFALRTFEKEKSQATLFMGSLIIVLLMAYLSELFGVGSLIGALIAGMMVRQTLLSGAERKPWRKNEISHSIHVISFGFLIPLFFVNVGLNTSLATLPSNILLVSVLIVIDILGTLIGTIIGVLASKGTLAEGLIVGFGVIPKGDTEIVIATLALNNGLINVQIFTAIIAVALFSTFSAPIIFKLLIRKYSEIAN